ncbi:hypothetical protein EDD11_003096 [Mortierella claussenii]|nr:hypothetical protein EDD11_003096 [Mortierella claussenii]
MDVPAAREQHPTDVPPAPTLHSLWTSPANPDQTISPANADITAPIEASSRTSTSKHPNTSPTEVSTSPVPPNDTYTRRIAPQRSNVKPRWHTQPYMVFLALRSMPNRTAARQELINAAVALDRKFSAEKGLPRVFTGKTPMNSASACLTNNGDKYFIPFKPEGSRSTHFRLAYAPGDFDTAVKEYDTWMEKLIKHDWPLCFGVPKEGAVPIHILEQKEQAQQPQQALEQGTFDLSLASSAAGSTSTNVTITAPVASSTISTDTTIETTTITTADSTITTADSTITIAPQALLDSSLEADGEPCPSDSKKRSTEPMDADLDDDSRSIKKVKAELDSDTTSESIAGASTESHDQDVKVTHKLEQLELRSTGSGASSSRSTPARGLSQDPEITPASSAFTPTLPATEVATTTAKPLQESTPNSKAVKGEKVDEYRLEDLDLSNVPTSLNDVVRVDISTIPNSGNGLFAKIDLPASTPLGFYFGVPMTENEFDSLKDGVGVASHYSIMYRRTVLDATDENGMPYSDPNGRLYCPFHFMNEDPSGNITFITGSVVNQVICQTNRDVKAGEELFVFYGKEVDRFWEKESSTSEGSIDQKGGRAGSRSRASSPTRREEPATDRPRRNNIYKPTRYTR